MTSGADPSATTFEAWLDAREPLLRRKAHLLVADPVQAQALVRSALAAALRAGDVDPAVLDAAARRVLVAGVGDASPAGLGEPVVWDYLTTLDPQVRIAAVEHRPEGEEPEPTAVQRVVADLAGLLGVDEAEARRRLATALRHRASTVPQAPTTYAEVAALVRRRRTRRRLVAAVSAAAVAAVAAPILALSGGGLPMPVTPRGPTQTPAVTGDARVAWEPFPPPWVLLPANRRARPVTVRVELVTTCSDPADEEFRSLTVIRAGCRTEVVHSR